MYQKRATSATYDLVYQKVTAQAQPTIGWVSSGALDYKLEQGKSYAVGVHITGTATVWYYPGTVASAGFIAASAALEITSGSSQPPPSSTLSSTTTPSNLRYTTTLSP